jgi:fatty acid desaturase
VKGGRGPRAQVLVALCAAGVALFNFPLLIVWDQPVTVLGLPLLPVALFAVWAVLVVVLALVSERGSGPEDDER